MIALVTNTRRDFDMICRAARLKRTSNQNYELKNGKKVVFVNSMPKACGFRIDMIINKVQWFKLSRRQYKEIDETIKYLQLRLDNSNTLKLMKSRRGSGDIFVSQLIYDTLVGKCSELEKASNKQIEIIKNFSI